MLWLGLALCVLMLFGLIRYACFWQKFTVDPADYPWREKRQQQSLDKLTDELLQKMTLAEKIQQLSGDGGPQFLVRLGINVLLLGRFPNTYSGRNERLHIPPFSFSDGPRGVVIGRATCFPVAMARAASWDIALEQRVGDAIGKELRATGANYFGGLCINLLRHPGWGRAQECYGEDPYLTGELGVALLQSIQRHHVMVCAKHFAVNSIENSRFYLDVHVDKRTLHEVYFPHFKRCVDAGVASLMSSYNKLNGERCGHHEYLLTDVLRTQWGFKGFVTSDWLWGIYETQRPVIAGMDVEMPYARFYGKKLQAAVSRGDIDEKIIDRNARRVIRTKLDFISRSDLQRYSVDLLACEEHRRLAQEVAEKSMVLLKNHGDILPLKRDTACKIAIVGELAREACIGDHGSSRVSPPYVVSLLEGLQSYIKDKSLDIAVEFHDGKNVAAACALAATADWVMVVAGYRHNDEGENLASNHKPGGKHKVAIGGDRTHLSLHPEDIDLIQQLSNVNPNTLVTLIGGSAIITSEWESQVKAILMAWYPGMEGGHAFARILFGDVNPSGKLPFSVPKKQSDLVVFEPFAETARYDYYHGYTHFDKQQSEPAYAFGFGLSYTSFSLQMLTLDADLISEHQILTVGIQVKNTGQLSGEEVIQLYIGFDDIIRSSGIDRPHKLLRGFHKVLLQPDENQAVVFSISANDLKRFDPETGDWLLDKGSYQVLAARHANDAQVLSATFTVI